MAHLFVKIWILTAGLTLLSSAQFRGVIPTGTLDTNSITNTIKNHKEVSECSCDLTSNSWDMSWCCDSECPSSTLSLWNSDADSFCNSVIYEELRPFTECMDKNYFAFTNDRMGITIDDNDSKDDLWVTLDDGDSSNTFYEEINFANAQDANKIMDRWFEWEDTTDDDEVYVSNNNIVYNYGNVIERYLTTRNVRLPMPAPNLGLSGNCDFSSYAVFGVDTSVTCNHKIGTASVDWQSILSPSTYAGFAVTKYRNGTDTVTPTIANGSTDPATVTGATWANHLTNLEIIFKFAQEGEDGFIIEAVEIAYSTDTATKNDGDVVQLTVITKYQSTSTDVEERSGNPGYLSEKRLLLASLNFNNLVLSGYNKKISDSVGDWLPSTATLSSVTDNYVNFMEDVNLQCKKPIASAGDLQTECSSTAYQGYFMFNQFTKYGRYGDSRISDFDDWHDIIPVSITTAPSYDAATQTCNNMITGIQYEVLVSEIGYEDQLQSYIVAINANPIRENIAFTGTSINLYYKVMFTYYTILPSEIRKDGKISADFPPKVSNDIGSQAATTESSTADDKF